MTSANPAMDADFSVSEPTPTSHRRRGKRIFKLMVFATAVGFVAAKMRGRHASPDGEADDGV